MLGSAVKDYPLAGEPCKHLADFGGLLLVPPSEVFGKEELGAWRDLAWVRMHRDAASLFWKFRCRVGHRVAREVSHDPDRSRLR